MSCRPGALGEALTGLWASDARGTALPPSPCPHNSKMRKAMSNTTTTTSAILTALDMSDLANPPRKAMRTVREHGNGNIRSLGIDAAKRLQHARGEFPLREEASLFRADSARSGFGDVVIEEPGPLVVIAPGRHAADGGDLLLVETEVGLEAVSPPENEALDALVRNPAVH